MLGCRSLYLTIGHGTTDRESVWLFGNQGRLVVVERQLTEVEMLKQLMLLFVVGLTAIAANELRAEEAQAEQKPEEKAGFKSPLIYSF